MTGETGRRMTALRRRSIPGWTTVLAVISASLVMAMQAGAAPRPPETAYLAQNTAAMKRMMADMAIKPGGDVDRDFVDMMVPHHQGGIDMAMAVLRYGHNEKVRRLAQEIIVTQQEEIAALRRAVGEPAPASTSSPVTNQSAARAGAARAQPMTDMDMR